MASKALQRPTPGFPNPSDSGARVAVIGGGISGLFCARKLKQLGHRPVVFDTGRHAVGGRVSSRILQVPMPNGKKKAFKVDHSTQFFTATDPSFDQIVQELESRGAVREWKGPVGEVEGGNFQDVDPKGVKRWVGVGGIDSLPKALAAGLPTQIDTWVAKVERQDDGTWRLFQDNAMRRPLSSEPNTQSDFDYIVVSHNGKCAERLMREAEVPRLHRLLQCKFGCTPPPAAKMQLSSLWVVMFAVDGSLNLPFEGAFVKGHPDLCWAADNSKKLGYADHDNGIETWTLVSSRSYGTRNKVPQEAIPAGVEEQVVDELLRAFERASGLKERSIKPIAQRVQLWGAGVPMNIYRAESACILDSQAQAGICGDWIVEPSVQGAGLSGMAMADSIHNHFSGDKQDVGLNIKPEASMQPHPSPACGAFPGMSIEDANPPVQGGEGSRNRGGRGRGGGGRGSRGRSASSPRGSGAGTELGKGASADPFARPNGNGGGSGAPRGRGRGGRGQRGKSGGSRGGAVAVN